MSGAVYNVQEAWTMPFAFCTREKHPWTQFAESAETGKVAVQDTAVQDTVLQLYCCTGHCSTVVLLYMAKPMAALQTPL